MILLLALAGATYLYYTHWRSKQPEEAAFPYIPKSATLVYEVANFGQQWEQFQQTPLAKVLNHVPACGAIQQGLNLIQNFSKTPTSLNEVPLTISVHGLSEEDLGCIFYFNTHDATTKSIFETLLSQLKQDESYSATVRNYAGYKLTEVSKQGAAQPLSYVTHNQYIIASCSSLLIEDVVRELTGKHQTRFSNLEKTENTQGKFYINFSQLPQLLRTFVKHDQVDTLGQALTTFAPASHLNIKATRHHMLLSGSAQDQEKAPQCLTHTLAGQTAGAMLLASYLPKDMAVLQHFTFSDAEQLLTAFQQYRSSTEIDNPRVRPDTNVLASALSSWLQGEIGHCMLATQHGHQKDQLVFIRVDDPHAFIDTLKELHGLTLSAHEVSHQPVNTYKLKAHCLQGWLTGQLFPDFEANYITHIDDYIVLANSPVGLQTWQTQYRQGATWVKTPQKNTWLESTLDEAQFSLLIDLSNVWPHVIHTLKPSWKQVFDTHADSFKKFRHVSLQLQHEPDTGCYMSILLHQKEQDSTDENPEKQVEDALQKSLAVVNMLQTETPMVCRPWLVKSHRTTGHYLLLQDAMHQLYFVHPTGKLLWKKTLEGPITTEVLEVDYYNNKKTQYLFATNSQVHLIDYHGHQVSKYPHPLYQPGQPIHLCVVDYNHNKDYRFLMATAKGDIYLQDKYYRSLPTWNPLTLRQEFAGTPFHLRVQGKDYFLALQTNGTLQALNRKGQSYPGFPIDLQALVSNPLLVRKGKTADDTSLTILTEAGQHICLNLRGNIQETVQLDQSEGIARFTMCPNCVEGHQYIIIRHDMDKITVLNEARDVLFELQHQSKNLIVQYYNFGGSYQFYVLTNTDTQLTYLYDHTGKMLHDTPWNNSHKVSLVLSEADKQLQLYVGFETQLLKYTLPYERLVSYAAP